MEVEERNYLKEPITWRNTLDAEIPYEAVHDGKNLTLKINDFPEEHLYSLFLDNNEIATFDDWPINWIREANDSLGAWPLEENTRLIQGERTPGILRDIIGRSAEMQRLYQIIETVAQVHHPF
jgi:hypothetical protein